MDTFPKIGETVYLKTGKSPLLVNQLDPNLHAEGVNCVWSTSDGVGTAWINIANLITKEEKDANTPGAKVHLRGPTR